MSVNIGPVSTEALLHMPTHMEQPFAIGMLAAGAVAYVGARAMHDRKDEHAYTEFPNAALLNETVAPIPSAERKSRLADAAVSIAGVSLLGIGLLGGPTYSETALIEGASTIFVIDSSTTMNKTADMGGQTRSGALQLAFDGQPFESFDNNLAVIQVGATAAISLPLSENVTKLQLSDSIKTLAVDPNGTNLEQAMALAEQMLPTGETEQTIIVVTDGTVQSSQEALQTSANSLETRGINVEVIVPGTADASYQLVPGAPLEQSGIKQEVMTVFDSEPNLVTNQAELTVVLQDTLKQANEKDVPKRWYGLEVLGAVLAAIGVSKMLKRGFLGR